MEVFFSAETAGHLDANLGRLVIKAKDRISKLNVDDGGFFDGKIKFF